MNYYYLVSSLPMINFSQANSLAVTIERLTELCRENLTPKDMQIFESVEIPGDINSCSSRVVRDFLVWDINLRNAVLSRRSNSQNAIKYKREEMEFFSEVESLVQEASSKANALEREMFLDELRIRKIDELLGQHRFDIEFLCAFKLKLILISKYSKLSAEAGEKNFNLLVDDIIKNSNLTE